MGIVRLAKCLRMLNSLTEFSSREMDIKNKISGNRVYMDFVSIVYKIQTNVATDLNYLLFCFILSSTGLLNTTELMSEKFLFMLKKYKQSLQTQEIIDLVTVLHKNVDSKNYDLDGSITTTKEHLQRLTNDSFISHFKDSIRAENTMNQYIYHSVVDFIVDMLVNKLVNVEYVLIAFDGIPSFGKIQEQRQRRYMRYTFIEFQKLIAAKYVSELKEETSNLVLTPDLKGARMMYDVDHFQVDIRSAIDYVYSKYHSADLQKDITTHVLDGRKNEDSDKKIHLEVEVIDRPYGEGEKILMDKLIHDYQTYHDDKTYVFYSPDGDSVILCLYIYIKTKVKALTVVKAYTTEPSDRHNEQTQYVDSKTLYNNIVLTVEKFAKEKYDLQEDMDNICTDFIMMINFFGNDFIHQIPTMEISATIMDLLYIYSKYIRDHQYITQIVNQQVQLNYQSLKDFLIELAEFEQFMMLDTYMIDVDEKNKILKYFGNVFPCRYLLDYRDSVTELKTEIHSKITNGTTNIETIRQIVSDGVDTMNKKGTVTGKKYGEIWMRIEIKNIGDYAGKIVADPDFLLARFPRFVHNLRSKRNRDEKEIRQTVDKLEENLIHANKSIDLEEIFGSNDKKIRDFAFDYGNIRVLVPHNQMLTTDQDIDLYLLEWKSGKWMNIMNAFSFEIGYDWRKGKPKKIEYEMKRYQYDMLELNNTNMNRMVGDWLRTFSWMCDYYMNTDDQNTNTEISTWSFNYDRSPFMSHIAGFLVNSQINDMRSIMKGFYKRSLVEFDQYLKSDKHRFYIYPQPSDIVAKIDEKHKINFPDMLNYVAQTINLTSDAKNSYIDKKNRVFDCRMCPYFSKCIFKSKHMTFKELMGFDIDSVAQYKVLKRKIADHDPDSNHGRHQESDRTLVIEKDKDQNQDDATTSTPPILSTSSVSDLVHIHSLGYIEGEKPILTINNHGKTKISVKRQKNSLENDINTYSARLNPDRISHVEI